MRLLKFGSHGELSITEDFIDNIPSYAILSHTWGSDYGEVTFDDLKNGSGKSKAGYAKIQFCGEQARKDGLQYFWVDTCCIDKANHTELAEAIVSMFLWYREAVKCYVYLSDVSVRSDDKNQTEQIRELKIQKSRWFTRGWTLQELLAPESVEFFSREGERLGDRNTLEREIHETTGIPIAALRGAPLSNFSVDEKMQWAEKRTTRRKEDKAYCLLGIFNLFMYPMYGERENAFNRLEEEINKSSRKNQLDLLPYAAQARFNSYDKQHDPFCLPDTRVDVLQKIMTWADEQDQRCVFWLYGMAGTGKSTIARTLARKYCEQDRLGASFFFSRGGGDVSHARKFFTSIAVQLADRSPSLKRCICEAIAKHSDIASQSLRDQWRQLVLQPLSNLDGKSLQSSLIFVIDALDECESDDDVRAIVQLLAEARSLGTVRLRIFVTSRPEIPIRYGIHKMREDEHQDFALHEISRSTVDHDISIFLEDSFRAIREERVLPPDWPGQNVIEHLVQNAGGLFIWAATACRFIREGKRLAATRLSAVLQGDTSLTAPRQQLNEIYVTVLKNSVGHDHNDQEKEGLYKLLKGILGSIVILFSPLSADSLASLLRIPREDVDQTLEDLHAILAIPKQHGGPIRLLHPSFRDFFLDEGKRADPFWVDERQAHSAFADSCVRLMSTSLKQDICGLGAPGALTADVENSRVDKCLPPGVQYACLHWAQHLQKSGAQVRHEDRVHKFLQEHFLHWIEALSLMRKTSEGILAITSLESAVVADTTPRLHAFIHDAKRFALHSQSILEEAPLQIYYSSLIFAPEKSLVREQFKQTPRWIQRLPQVQTDWSPLLQTLEGHSSRVEAVAFSQNGKLLASASWDTTAKLWDPATGAALQTLTGHSGRVEAVAFSQDSKLLASASWDKTVKLWDLATGTALQTLKGHLGKVKAVAFSQNGKLLASGSWDMTIRLWDPIIGAVLQTLTDHSGGIEAVKFSQDSKLLVSASWDKTVRLWDSATGAALQILAGHLDVVQAVTFSYDGKLLASGSWDTTVRLWNPATGAALQTLTGHSKEIQAVAFSPDSKLLASGSWDKTVTLWDPATGAALQTLVDSSGEVEAVEFSPDSKLLASGSWDTTVMLWDLATGANLQTLANYSSRVETVAFSPDGKLLASGSWDKMVRLWDTATGARQQTLKGHSSVVQAVAFSQNSKLLASASWGTTIRLWDPAKGAALQILIGHLDGVQAVAFSPDGKLLASASVDRTVRLWDLVTGAALQTLTGHSGRVEAVAFSPDGKLLASGSWDKTVKLWDPATGQALRKLEGHTNTVRAVGFSRDGSLLASGSEDGTVRLWHPATGQEVRKIVDAPQVSSISLPLGNRTILTNIGAILVDNDSNLGLSLGSSTTQISMIKNGWIQQNDRNLLWLPHEYRSACSAFCDNTFAFGLHSGQVRFIQLDYP